MKAKKFPLIRRRDGRGPRAAPGVTGCRMLKACRNRADRRKRGAIGNAPCGFAVGESSTIVLNKLNLFTLMAPKKIKSSIAAHLWLLPDRNF
jgi:hypothetical protein